METIKFTNEYGDEVNESQKDVLEYFYKIYLVDGKPVKRENYIYGKFNSNTYYVSSVEEIETLLKAEPTVSFEYFYEKNKHRINEFRSYANQNLTSCWIIVKNNNHKTICDARYESEDGELKLIRIEKSFYKDGELLYNFDYNKDGSCFLVSNEQKYQSDIYGWDIKDIFWEGLEYYKTAEPIIPENKKAQT